MMKYTPGPWKADICEVLGLHHAICECDGSGYHEEDKANARLIAAAPDMLEAAKLALTELDRIGSDIGFEPERYQERIHALDALSRAVRKAEGE